MISQENIKEIACLFFVHLISAGNNNITS